MKKNLLTLVLLVFSIVLYAQNDVTQFLGIPVDGSKAEMIQKLKAKGYTSTSLDKDVLEGQFNGMDVHIHVVTNNDKVCRIMVCDVNAMSESDIKIRFNRLCRQFLNNKKYVSASLSPSDCLLSDEENISYEMFVHNKRYEAAFYQAPVIDTLAIANELQALFLSKYTEDQLLNPTEDIQNEITSSLVTFALEKISKKSVWFMISEDFPGRYVINMYYDNEYNKANGEDL